MADYSLAVLVHGNAVKTYEHNSKTYVEGRKGSEFSIQLRNNTSSQVEAVVSVDGKSVNNGEAAAYATRGYILDAHSTLTIPGWRLNNQEVAKFGFNSVGGSYAAKTGVPENIGVISAAFFKEKVSVSLGGSAITVYSTQPWVYQNLQWPEYPNKFWLSSGGTTADSYKGLRSCTTSASLNSGPACAGHEGALCADQTSQNIGISFGQKADHQVHEVSFVRASASPDSVISVYYNDRQGLETIGINFKPVSKIAAPNPFPGNPGQACKPPDGWVG